jgi:hypothetical protein
MTVVELYLLIVAFLLSVSALAALWRIVDAVERLSPPPHKTPVQRTHEED